MAEIEKIQSGRVGIQGAPAAATPQVVYPQITPETALLQQAKYQGTMADKLDRMTSIIFREGAEISQKAGLQWAAENPLTGAQLQAMAKGDLSTVGLGNNFSMFDNAVRKVRAFELSAHAEAEASTKLLDIYQKAERGELDFDGVRDQVKALTDGFGQSLANVDPESSFKYRASMATMGNKIIDETAKLEGKKRIIGNGIKTERLYQNFMRMSEMVYNGENQIDPSTGQPIVKDEIVDAMAENFLNNTIALVGIQGAQAYQTKILKDLTDTKVNALTKYIADEFGAMPDAFSRLRVGDAGRLTDIYQSLPYEGQAKVMQTYLTKISTDMSIRDQTDKANKTDRELQTIDLYKKLQGLGDGPQKNAIIRQLADLRVVGFDDLNRIAKGGGESNPMALFNTKEAIYNGTITSSDQIRNLPLTAGDKVKMLDVLHSNTKSEDSKLDNGLRRLAKIPNGLVSLDPKSQEFKTLRNLEADAMELKASAARKGEILTNATILETLGKRVEEKQNSQAAQGARTSLAAFEEKAGGKITSETFDSFAKKVKDGKVKNVKEKDLQRIRNLVDQAEGNL
jgi:predicted DNA-binding protein YlxM (UPF0122 family)